MFDDFYAILEIDIAASKSEIKSAYREQALKWHPDKNPGIDTTEKMQKIIEAHLILSDDEARIRYDKEYIRFKNYQQEKKKEEYKKQEQEKKTEQKPYEQKTEKPKEEYSSYQFDDELLKKWMENARKQAMRHVKEIIIEFRDSSKIGFGTFFKTALIAIAVSVIFAIIVLILKSI